MRVITILLLSLLMSACTQSYITGLKPQSHFDYPNSNVYPMGKTMGKASTTSFYGIPMVSSAMQKAAIRNALSKKPGANVLINYVETKEITPIGPITILTVRVEGTAAKMEIGTQNLK